MPAPPHLGPRPVPAPRRPPRPPLPRPPRPRPRPAHGRRRPASPTSAAAPATSPPCSPTAGPPPASPATTTRPRCSPGPADHEGPRRAAAASTSRTPTSRAWTPDRAVRPDRLQRRPAVGARPPRRLRRLARRPRPRRHPRLPGARQLRRPQPRPHARTRDAPPAGSAASPTPCGTPTPSTPPPATSTGSPASAARPTSGRRRTSTCSRARTRCSTGSRAPACAPSSPPSPTTRAARDAFVAEYRGRPARGLPARARTARPFPFRRIFAVAHRAAAGPVERPARLQRLAVAYQPRLRLQAVQAVPGQVHQVRRHLGLLRLADVQPPLAGQRDHADQGLGVQRGQLGVEAAGLELRPRMSSTWVAMSADQRGEGARRLGDGGVPDQDAEAVRVLLDVVQQGERRLLAAAPAGGPRSASWSPCPAAAASRGPPRPRTAPPCRRSARTPPAWTPRPSPRSPPPTCPRSPSSAKSVRPMSSSCSRRSAPVIRTRRGRRGPDPEGRTVRAARSLLPLVLLSVSTPSIMPLRQGPLYAGSLCRG